MLYRLRHGGRSQHGLVAAVPVIRAARGLLRPHERTRKELEDALLAELERDGSDREPEPVSLAYRPQPSTRRLLARLTSPAPAGRFLAGAVEHELWIIHDVELGAQLTRAFAGLDALYILDGHHRAAAAMRFAQRHEPAPDDPAANLLGVLFPADELVVESFHRCVGSTLSAEHLLEAIAARVRVASAPPGAIRPARPGVIAMWLGGRWYLLEHGRPGGIDALMLQDMLLAPVFGVTDPTIDERLRHVPPTVAPEELAGGCGARGEVAFVLHPPRMDDVMAVADAGERLPPKSTWFAPKPAPGLLERVREALA